jgi:hypothetical protein
MWPGVDDLMAGDSYMPALQEALYGGLGQGESRRATLPLVAGVPFRIVGLCDGDCSDLDLTLYDGSGKQIATDIAIDDTPLLNIEVDASGTYEVEVAMVTCSIEPCAWSVMAYAPSAALASASSPAGPSAGDRRTGDLRAGDQRLTSGEFYDEYTIEATAGSRLVVSLESGDFDTYLIVRSPGGDPFENDDFEGSTTLSRVDVDVTETGTWRVLATSYEAGQTGSYVVSMSTGAASTAARPGASAGGPRREAGSLAGGDETLTSGEFVDYFTVDGRRGEALVVDLTSREFDPYLIVRGPDGEQLDNDDFEGDRTRSLISLDATLDGEYTVMVTSCQPGESGAYTLLIATENATSASNTGARVERGALASGDQTLRSGEYLDEYTFEGRPGQRVRVDVGSSDFDTYLMLMGPGEFRMENDDVEGAPGRSVIEADLTEMGTYRVVVTSYSPDETGAYELSIETGAVTTASAEQRDVQALQPGRSASGRLEEGDGQIESGEFRDLWVFDGVAGQTVSIEMASRGFDSYLGLISPSGDLLDENDDADGRTDLSRIDITLRESGRYRVMATSFASGETGEYSLALRTGTTTAAASSSPSASSSSEGGRVFGIFAGISDYGGRANDLAYTADDAVRFANAMTEGAGMRTEDAFVLTDSEATTGNIRAAFREIGSRMSPGDRFVFFYSGHGSRVPRAAGPDRADPDGLDETISLYDADITDDEMNDLMALVDGGLSVMVLDACFSGGFSKDVISAPGRIGFFSSEEDVTSQVAAKFRAGGYLAIFAADAIGGRYADADGDGAINAIELSQYLHERYRADVKAGGPEEFVRTGGPQSGFQHLVIDRGSIAPYDIVFR